MSPKRLLTFSGLYGIILQKIKLLTTALRTSNPTFLRYLITPFSLKQHRALSETGWLVIPTE
jgi:hypothetical protein